MLRATLVLAILAFASCAGSPIALELNRPIVGKLSFLGDEQHFIYSVPEAEAQKGLVVKTEWPAGSVHLYARCDTRPGLGSGQYWRRSTVPTDAQANDLYLPDLRDCKSPKVLHIVAYGFRQTDSYVIQLAHSVVQVQHHAIMNATATLSEFVYYEASVEMISRFMITAQLDRGSQNGNGINLFYRRNQIPDSRVYDGYVSLSRTSGHRCLEKTTPDDGLYYIGVAGRSAEVHYRLQFNLNPIGTCGFQSHFPGDPRDTHSKPSLRRLSNAEVKALKEMA